MTFPLLHPRLRIRIKQLLRYSESLSVTQRQARSAALSDILDKQMPGGSMVKFIQVHVEHVTGKATVSAVPADDSVLLAGVPGTNGPAVAVFGGPTKPKIFIGPG